MTDTHLSTRYGAKPQRRPLPQYFWYVLTACAVLAGVAFVFWVQSADSDQPSGRDVGFELTSSDEVQLTFEVSKRAEDTAICAIKALNTAGAPVGWKEVAIGPYADDQGNGISVQTVHLRVLGEATTVTVDTCWKA
ncbi:MULTISPECIES: DUF4307 domain-containing protein [Rothia]|uniref:DUF4307 domain-containing protein n=1 Tax=Rothia nasimurium TaxID=85336 RepID=A0A1Y1RLV3_9MICC|nr:MULTISPECIES: DUF4307 domain-containing protein [Rothia]ORC15411.1 hypothetical protein A7979_06605 [Rothia nasimurium]